MPRKPRAAETADLLRVQAELLAVARCALAWWHANPRNMEREEPPFIPAARAAIARAEGGK